MPPEPLQSQLPGQPFSRQEQQQRRRRRALLHRQRREHEGQLRPRERDPATHCSRYLSSKVFHVGSKFTEKVVALMEKGQVGIHEGQHLAGRKRQGLRGLPASLTLRPRCQALITLPLPSYTWQKWPHANSRSFQQLPQGGAWHQTQVPQGHIRPSVPSLQYFLAGA